MACFLQPTNGEWLLHWRRSPVGPGRGGGEGRGGGRRGGGGEEEGEEKRRELPALPTPGVGPSMAARLPCPEGWYVSISQVGRRHCWSGNGERDKALALFSSLKNLVRGRA